MEYGCYQYFISHISTFNENWERLHHQNDTFLFLFSILTIFFWLASLAVLHTLYIHFVHTLINFTSKFHTQYGTVILSLYSPYPNYYYEKIQLPIPCIHERAFSYFSCPELHDFTPFKTKKFWGRTPLIDILYNIKLPCHLYVSVEKRFHLYKKKNTMPYRK